MWLVLAALIAQSAGFQADGVKALDSKQYDAAVELFTKAVAEDPKDYSARFHLALAYSLLGKNAEAIPQYKTALELHPGLYEAEINLGISLLENKDSGAAIPYLESAASRKVNEFQPAFYLGRARLEQKQWTEAESAFQTALGLNASSAPAELGLGEALAGQGRRKDAEPHFRKAVALDPLYRDSLLRLGSLFEENRESAEAIAIYRDFPDDPGALEHLGALLLDAGHADQAIPVLEKAVARSPSAANRVALAQAYVDNQQPDKAGLLMTQVIAAEPRDYRLRMLYGRMLRDQRNFTGAGPQFLAAAEVRPDSVEAWSELAAVLILAEQYPQAVAALDRVRALGAETSGHYYARAMALDHLRLLKEALASYSKFLETDQGKNPDQEFIARQRVRIIQNELNKR